MYSLPPTEAWLLQLHERNLHRSPVSTTNLTTSLATTSQPFTQSSPSSSLSQQLPSTQVSIQQLFTPESSPPFAENPSKERHPCRITLCCKSSGPKARCISCNCCQEERSCVNCVPQKGNILNVISPRFLAQLMSKCNHQEFKSHRLPRYISSLSYHHHCYLWHLTHYTTFTASIFIIKPSY